MVRARHTEQRGLGARAKLPRCLRGAVIFEGWWKVTGRDDVNADKPYLLYVRRRMWLEAILIQTYANVHMGLSWSTSERPETL